MAFWSRVLRQRAPALSKSKLGVQRDGTLTSVTEMFLNRFRAMCAKRSGMFKPALPLSEATTWLDEDLRGELDRSRMLLSDVLQLRPQWFQIEFDNDGVQQLRLTEAALSTADAEFSPAAAAASPERMLGSRFADISKPPLTAAEIQDMRLPLLVASTLVPYRRNAVEPPQTIPPLPSELIPRRLSDGACSVEVPPPLELEPFDQLYRKKGYFAPTDVLNRIAPFVPTFFVEIRHVLQLMSLATKTVFLSELPLTSDGRYIGIAKPFSRYPMVFTLHRMRSQKTLVKVNSEFDFVRSHPLYGRVADRALRQHSQDFSTRVGVVSREQRRLQQTAPNGRGAAVVVSSLADDVLGPKSTADSMPAGSDLVGAAATAAVGAPAAPRHLQMRSLDVDTQILMVLLVHLPLCSPKGQRDSERYPFVPLVQWINGFPPDHLAILNSAPQQRVIRIVQKYKRLFQLSTSDSADSETLFRERDAQISAGSASAVGDTESSKDDWSGEEIEIQSESAPEAPPHDLPLPDADDERRVAAFKTAISDELIGVEDLVTGSTEELFDKGEAADNATAAEVDATNDEAQHGDEPVNRTHQSEALDVPLLASPLDAILIRRLPPSIAPGALCDHDEASSPDAVLLRHILERVAAPKVVRVMPTSTQRRWVAIERLYQSIPPQERGRLRPFRGLANFLRLHGRLLEVSGDARYVISHDPNGALPPLIPTQVLFCDGERTTLPAAWDEATSLADRRSGVEAFLRSGVEERLKYRKILGDSQIPTTRVQLRLLDPNNPLLQPTVFLEELADFLPGFPVPWMALLKRLPLVMKAAMPQSLLKQAQGSELLDLWRNDKGVLLVARKGVATRDAADANGLWSLSRAIQALEEAVESKGSVSIGSLHWCIPDGARKAILRESGSLEKLVESLPNRFICEADGDSNRIVVKRAGL